MTISVLQNLGHGLAEIGLKCSTCKMIEPLALAKACMLCDKIFCLDCQGHLVKQGSYFVCWNCFKQDGFVKRF